MKSGRHLNATAVAVAGVLVLVTLVPAVGQPPPGRVDGDDGRSSRALVGFDADQNHNRLTNIDGVMSAPVKPSRDDPLGACCVDLVCVATNYEPQCLALGGRWFPGETCDEFECPVDCEHRIELWDCYGDGWTGNTLDVLVNGVTVLSGITLVSGPGPANFTFMAGNAMTVQTIYHAVGSYPDDPYYFIYGGAGYPIAQDGTADGDCYQIPTGVTVEGNCAPPAGACCVDQVCVATNYEPQCLALGGRWFAGESCPEFECPTSCFHTISLYDCYGDGWTGNTLDVLVNGVTVLNGITLVSGPGPANFTFVAGDGMTIQTIYHAIGSYPDDPYYFIYDGAGYPIAQDGTAGGDCYQIPTGVTVEGNCLPPTGACCGDGLGTLDCMVVSQDTCAALGGLYLGNFTVCSGLDCNGNGIADTCDIEGCDGSYWCLDCQPDGIPDGCQLGAKKRGESLLYAPSDVDDPAFRSTVSAFLGAPVDYFDARIGTPTAAQMESYAAVLTWPNYMYANSVAFGNNLADYVDAGGRVILGQGCLPTGFNHLDGRIMTEPGYNPATATTGGFSSYAGDGVTCIHEGVTAYSAVRDNISLMPGATSDGHWLDGIPAVAYWPGLAPSIFYSPGNTGDTFTTGDWARLTANMVYCWPASPLHDCNGNLIPDDCDIAHCDGSLWCQDCDENGFPDECECPLQGDMDNSGAVDGLDIQNFVDCALGGGERCLCGDFDCNGAVDPGDLPGFVSGVLTSP